MPIATDRRTTFLRRSVQARIGASVTTATGNAYTVVYASPGGTVDPDSASNDVTAPLRGWALVSWPLEQAGKRGASFMQVDAYYRFGGVQGGAGTDPFRQEAAEIIDAIADLFTGIGVNGVRRAYVPVLDFTVPAAPVDTGVCMLCINSRGDMGEVDDVRDVGAGVQDGLWQITARWRFQHPQDVIGPAGFYVD
jgi:hypothetical protein